MHSQGGYSDIGTRDKREWDNEILNDIEGLWSVADRRDIPYLR